MSTVRRQQLEEIIECLGSPLRTEMYHVLGSEALSAELRGMLAARVHQDSGELVQRYLLFMDPGRRRSGARGSSSHARDPPPAPPPPPPPPPPFPPVRSPTSFCTATATAPPLPPPPIGFQHVPPVVLSLAMSSGRFVLGATGHRSSQ